MARQAHWPPTVCALPTQLPLYPFIIPYLFIPKPRWSLPFPTLDSIPKYPIKCLVQSQNALPHSMPQTPRQSPSWKVIHRAASVDSFWWVSQLDTATDAPLGQLWERPKQGVHLLESIIWVSLPAIISLCSSVLVYMGLWWAELSCDGRVGGRGWVGFVFPYLPFFRFASWCLWRTAFYHIT